LITGITGFAGGYLAEHLIDQGDEVLGIASQGRWRASSSPRLADRVRLVAWDVAGAIPDRAAEAIAQFAPEAVYHLAAISVPADCGSAEQPTPRAVAVNVDGTRRLVELCERLCPRARLLFVSTSHVYAPVSRQNPRVDENAAPGPVDGYGQTKLRGERIVLAARPLAAVVARAFQHTGPRQNARMMLPEWASQFAAGAEVVHVLRPNAFIDLSDVRDVVRAYRLLVQRGASGTIYNVGSGCCLRSGDVLDELRRLADPQRPIREQSSEIKQDPIADVGRLRQATLWQPRIDWRQTVADTWHYWSRHATPATTAS
jgi:GDP-4-dehydro-6-deoxy-D-mannose reductase